MVTALRGSVPVIAVVILVATTSGCGISPVAGTAVTGQSAQTTVTTTVAGGSPSRDGWLEFVLLDTSRVQQVGDPATPGLSMNAKGVFVVATLSIRNVGGTAVTFLDRDQTLIDSVGRKFKPNMAADIYANLGIHSTTINPGGELVVHIVFDVPAAAVPMSLILRQSDSSAGVTVPIG